MKNRENGTGKPGRPSIPPDDVRCTARAKNHMTRCKNYRLPGMTVCHFHGGKTPAGLANPNAKDGRYSRLLPARLAERFEALAIDPEALSLARDVALLDLRAEELLGRLDSGESTVSWRAAKDALARLRGRLAAGDAPGIRTAMSALSQILSDAAGRESTWGDLRGLLQERRLLVETERRRLVDLHQMVTVEELLLFAQSLVGIVNRHVDDPATRTAIAMDVRGLLHHAGNPRAKTVASYAAPVDHPSSLAGERPGQNGTA